MARQLPGAGVREQKAITKRAAKLVPVQLFLTGRLDGAIRGLAAIPCLRRLVRGPWFRLASETALAELAFGVPGKGRGF